MGPLEYGVPMRRRPADAPIALPPPPRLTLPLLYGEEPLVQPGQSVARGQRLADGPDTLPVCAPVSGIVAAVSGGRRPSIVLENDGRGRTDPAVRPRPVLDDWDGAALLSLLYEAGVRLPDGTPLAAAAADAGPGVQTLIVSAMDWEPALCAEDAVLSYDGEAAFWGIRLLERLLRPRAVRLAVGIGQTGALAAAERWVGGRLTLAVAADRYPGAHPQLLARELGGAQPGQTPREAGVLVVPVSAAAAAGRAAYEGLPAVERLVSVSWPGGRATVRTPLGAPIRALLRAAGAPAGTVLLGGPMAGTVLTDTAAPVTQAVTGLTVLDSRPQPPATACIRCGRCAAVCPADLHPWMAQVPGASPAWRGCLACGACQYVCPAHLPLLTARGRRAAG